jgi:diguanylate cyclase (GGDEF)-like protein/PAS domain S-box-containing protein
MAPVPAVDNLHHIVVGKVFTASTPASVAQQSGDIIQYPGTMPLRSTMKTDTSRTLVASAVAISLLILVLAASSLSYLMTVRDRVVTISAYHNAKIDLLHEMSRVVRERSLRMYAMYFKADPWSRDNEFLRFNELAAEFIQLRDRLQAMDLSDRERAELAQALEIIRTTAPLQEGIVTQLHAGDAHDVERRITEDLPLENRLLTVFDRLIGLVRAETRRAAQQAEDDVRDAFRLLSGVTLAVLALTLWAMHFVRRRILGTEAELFEEKELEELTLQNIIDGVIKTDTVGRILTMNPVARQLTGWSEEQARGQWLDSVYVVRESNSDTPLGIPDFIGEVSGTISRTTRYLHLIRPNRDHRLIEETISPVFTAAGRLAHVAYIFRDVTLQKRQIDRINWQATHDPLTRALNRNGFDHALRKELAAAHHTGECHSLLYIDLDDFKLINDRYGHAAGDLALSGLCRRIESCVRKGDQLARLGGDEFAVLLKHCNAAEAQVIAEEIRKAVETFQLTHQADALGVVGVSIGIAVLHPDTPDAWHSVDAADQACYLAKREGKNRIRLSA